MKKAIHPKYGPMVIVFPNGDKFETMSSSGKDSYNIEIDFRSHRAWTGQIGSGVNENADAVTKFNKKFSGFGNFATKKKESE